MIELTDIDYIDVWQGEITGVWHTRIWFADGTDLCSCKVMTAEDHIYD